MQNGEEMHAQTRREGSKKIKGMLKLWQQDVYNWHQSYS
jgi:hypothetical protein